MPTDLTLLTWTLILALAQIFITAWLRTAETGLMYNMGPRDIPGPPTGIVTGRMLRAQANLFETLPLFAAAVIIAHILGREKQVALCGAWLYLGARIAYVPLYAAGIPVIRSLVWVVSIVGLVMEFVAVLA